MQVHCDEGVAIHIGPEPCAIAREGGGEASVGERTGQALSRERTYPGSRRRRLSGRQHGRVRYASARTARRGRRPWHVRTLVAREPGDPTFDHRPRADLVRIGKARSRSR